MTPRRAKSGPPLVLVTDDHADTRLMYAEHLDRLGYEIETAENGLEALVLARRLRPEAIVMDLAMPVMDGWEAAQTIKSAPATRHITIIAVTAHSERQCIERAYTAGVDAVAVKPVPPAELARLIGAGIAKARSRQRG